MFFKVDKPYPKIRVEKKSPWLASILSHVYASNEGEMTAINQYFYEYLVIPNQEIAYTLEQISIVEMNHFELLGKTIELLGSSPIIADFSHHQTTYWNSDFIYYDRDLKTLLEIDIHDEETAIRNYQMILTVIDDKYVRELIERILEDEYLHLEIFTKLYESN